MQSKMCQLVTSTIATRIGGSDFVGNDSMNELDLLTSTLMPNLFGMSRPTSKTAMLFKQRRSMLEHLSCSICKGYLIDATVVNECMHSFCRSCIIKHLELNSYCPAIPDHDHKCETFIDRSNPLSIRQDKVLQSIVYKSIPGLYDDEMQRRRDFYGIEYSSSEDEDEEDDEDFVNVSPRSSIERNISHGDEKNGIMPHPKPFYKHEDQIDISIEPQTMGNSPIIYFDDRRQSLITRIKPTQQSHKQQQTVKQIFSAVNSQQYKSYLRCQAMLTVAHLKKLITAKFNVCPGDKIQLRYINDTLKDEYSLIDIAYIYDWRGKDHMRMFYVIERDISNIDFQYESQPTGKSSAITHGNTVASKQTVKRVCIDPKPRFYEEHRDKRIKYDQNNNSGFRSTRSRSEVSTSTAQESKKSTGYSVVTSGNGNLKINGNRIQTTSNGMANRELASRGSRANPKVSIESKTGKVSQSTSTVNKSNETGASKIIVVASPNVSNNLRFTAKPNISCSELQNGKTSQIVPYLDKSFQTTTVNQASVVSMASFTTASSKISTVSTATGTATNSYRNLIDTSPVKKTLDADTSVRSEPRTSHLQIRIVTTKQGYSISKPVSSGTPASTTTNLSHQITKPNAIAASGTSTTRAEVSRHIQATKADTNSFALASGTSSNHRNTYFYSNPDKHQSSDFRSSAGNNHHADSRQDILDCQQSGRHLSKQKPVYKTLVDPSKVKPPNFKRR